jgi:hypothetical protein
MGLNMPQTPAPPTHEQAIVIVKARVPHYTVDRQNAVATAALGVLTEPKHRGKPLLHAVKTAIARSYRHPKT